MIKSVFQQE